MSHNEFREVEKDPKTELDKILEKEYNVPEEVEGLAGDLDGGWWNYRIFEKENHFESMSGRDYSEKYFEIHEVYYKRNGEIWSWSENPMSIYFENFKDVGQLIRQIRNAVRKPVLKVVKSGDDEEVISTMKTLKQYKKTELSNWKPGDLWKEITDETRRE